MAKGRKPLSVGMKQNKEDFDRELKTYSTKALKNIITIAENSFDANTRLKANQYLLDKCYGKDYKAIVDETEQNTETKIMLQIVNPKQNMNIDKIKIGYYLNKNKKNLFELKHDSHFLKILGKNIDIFI